MNAIYKRSPQEANFTPKAQRLGSVTLVGAGPGAADLLTIRALKAIENADVVYYDSLVGDAVLDHIHPNTKKVFVGKRKAFKSMEQRSIERNMCDDALAGQKVVRLKGGDPFIFGRGGEELFNIRAAGVPVEVIPGVTAAGAAAADHGIPLTHRDVATSVTFATGHAFDGSTPELNADVLSKGTLVIYMGVSNADQIVARLLSRGVSGETPVALIERASLPGQRLVKSSLHTLADDISVHEVVAPALLIIGEVASLGIKDTSPTIVNTTIDSSESFEWVHHPMG